VNQPSALFYSRNIIGKVSRTFAIGINLLRGDLGNAVLTAYLLARILDTIEDDNFTPVQQRAELIALFIECLTKPEKIEYFVQQSLMTHGEAAHIELLHNSAKIFELFNRLPKKSAAIIQHWIAIMANGMQTFTLRYPNGIRIQTLEEYHQYCYFVAGTVGHLLTELFYEHSPWINAEQFTQLLKNAEAFGEALQTINILKDIATDAEKENEIFIPEEVLRAQGSSQIHLMQEEWRSQNKAALLTVIDLAQSHLERAAEYFYALPKMAIRIRLFCWLPLIYAEATLRDIKQTDAMLQPNGQVKISRKEIHSLLWASFPAVLSNKLSTWLIKKVRQRPYYHGI